MNAVPSPIALATAPNAGLAPWRAVAGWSLAQFALFTGTLVVLGSAIGWPGILREPAAKVLTTIHAQAFATSLGYSLYLVACVALIGMALALHRALKPAAEAITPWLDLLTVLGIASGVVKTLGIVRWLSVMPGLAASYHAAETPAALRPAIELVYTSFNAYAGAVGEILGVQLLSGLWIGGISAMLWRRGWRLTGAIGVACGLLFLLINLKIFVPAVGALTALASPLGLAWLLVLTVAAWRERG